MSVLTEDYKVSGHAAERVVELRTAGYKAYLVRVDARLCRVFIEPGKHPDLSRVPPRRK